MQIAPLFFCLPMTHFLNFSPMNIPSPMDHRRPRLRYGPQASGLPADETSAHHNAGRSPAVHTPSLLILILLVLAPVCYAFDNVLIVTIDTVRADHVGCYGGTAVKT